MVLRGPLEGNPVRVRCEAIAAEPGEVAVCRVLEGYPPSLAEVVNEQRVTTHALRSALGARAEGIAVFVATAREGDGVEDWARAWGATMVIA
jgi:hypothetical protein